MARGAVLVGAGFFLIFEVSSHMAHVHFQLSRSYLEEGKRGEAEKSIVKATKLAPYVAEHHAFLSQLILENVSSGRSEGAKEPQGTILPKNASKGARDPLDRALEEIEKAIGLDPSTPNFHRARARIFLRKGDLLSSFLSIARASELFPVREKYRVERDRLGDKIMRISEDPDHGMP